MQKKQEFIEQEDIMTRATARKVYKTEKAKKSAENKDYIPLIEPKKTTEIIEKQPLNTKEIEHIEKQGENKEDIIRPKKKPSRTYEKTIFKEIPLKGNSVLIITEKPQASAKIASALSNGKARQIKGGTGVYYYEFEKQGKNIIVACAVGHLFSLSQDIKGSNYPIFEISWKPNFEVKKRDFTKKYYQNLIKLIKKSKEIIIATDYDTEGEVIGYNIVRYIAQQPDAKRMKFSSLTSSEIELAYKNLHNTLDWGQAIAGETRHYLDWYYGINLSRALMSAIKTTGKFRIMSIGRVQGPALKLIVDKEKSIQSFKPEPFWRILINIHEKKDDKNKLELEYFKNITDKKELNKFKDLEKKEIQVKTEKIVQLIPPPFPFDLTTLQTEAYKFFSLTPSKTLQIAQQLYLSGLISYPRTSSQKIPDSINPKDILKRLSQRFKETGFIKKEKPIEGKKSDPAHPSIYPTGEFQEISGEEKKLYDLIAKRFIACFCEDAKVEYKTITGETEGLVFKTKGLEIKEKAWMEVYNTKIQERELKDMNGPAIIDKIRIEEDKTKPPKRYSPASIIKELEKRGLGTKATRASIIETLYNRGYVSDNKAIKATALGINIIDSLNKYSPIIIEEKLTREIEQDMEKMQEVTDKKKLEAQQKKVLQTSKTNLKEISKDFQKNEAKIGKEIKTALEESYKQEEKENELNFKCPKCQKGNLVIKYSPKIRRHFVACTAYPECKTTFSLPPNSLIKKTDKFCEQCNFPMLMSIKRGRKPWFFCFNSLNHKIQISSS